MTPRRFMRGSGVSLDACGVPRETLVAALRRTELLCNMPDSMANTLLEAMVGKQVRKGAVLFREGARGDSLVLKAAGTARVVQLRSGFKDTRVLATLSEPSVLGQDAFYGVDKRSLTARMLTDGTVFHIRRGVFADLLANGFVTWCEVGDVPASSATQVWIGGAETRPRNLQHAPCLEIDRLKRYVLEAPAGETVYCCSRDDTKAAFAAFLLSQRGLKAHAVRQGRKLSLPKDAAK